MSKSDLLLIGALVFPFLMMLAAVWPRLRAWLFALLPLAPLPALAAALLVPEGSLVLAPAPLRLTLQLDAPNAMLLAGAALLWAAAGFYARGYMAGATHRGSFALWWLLTMGGSFGICVVGDMTSFYLVFAIASLSAYGLVAHEDTAAAHRAASIYMALAMLGEAFLLLAFVMLAAGSGHGNLPIGEAVAHLPASLWRTPIIVLLTLGFGLKMGLVPLHAWMPLAHPVAPMPASAVLSGVIVNAGVIGLIRFLPLDVALPGAGAALMALGFFTAFYAVAVGLAQRHPKVVLAYSTVSQMGVICTILGAGLAAGQADTAALAAFYAVHHLFVKGALFLGIGVIALTSRQHGRWIMAIMTLLALSLAGLPFTSGALAKLAVKPLFDQQTSAWLSALTGAGSAMLMLHFLRRLTSIRAPDAYAAASLNLIVPWLLVAVLSLASAWVLFPAVSGHGLGAVVAPKAIWDTLWPLLLGAVLTRTLRRSLARLPPIPEGDVVVLAERLLPSVRRLGDVVAKADILLRQWPIAGALLLAIVAILGGVLQLGQGREGAPMP